MDRFESKEFNVIGKEIQRTEAVEKVTGKAIYFDDIKFPNMLYAKILRSTKPHAVIKKINIEKAKALLGVKEIITFDDIPHHFVMHQYLHLPSVMWYDSYLVEQKVRHYADRIAAVAAESEEIAEQALQLIEVEYEEELPTVFNRDQAFKPGQPEIHKKCRRGDNEVIIKNNIVLEKSEEIGNVEKGFLEADFVYENIYHSSRVHTAQIELSGAVAAPKPNGQIDVWATTQGIHACRINIASTLGVPLSQINVNRVYIGGSFGSHIHTGWIEPIVALFVMRTGQPVKGVLTREEMYYMCGRHPGTFKLKSGFKKDGQLVAMELDCTDGTGAYAYSGHSKMSLMTGFFMSMYKCPNLKYTGRTVYTNEPPLSAMRGAGNPQQNWAVETHMDEASRALNIDPIELRKKNILKVGDTFFGQGTDVISEINTCETCRLFDEGSKRIHWEQKDAIHKSETKPWIKKGIGISYGFHTSGAGSKIPSKFIMDVSSATIKLSDDGKAMIMNAVAEMGSGAFTAHIAIAAEEIGLKYEDVKMNLGDTNTSPFDTVTHASRGTYSSGQAVQAAARKVKEQILEWAEKILEVDKADLDVKNSEIIIKSEQFDNFAGGFNEGRNKETIPVSRIVSEGQSRGFGSIIASASVRPTACPPHYVVCFIEVEVDTRTGNVEVKKVVQGADAGTIIYPQGFKGQIIGAIHMGLGYALFEEVMIDQSSGKVLNPGFSDYKMLTSQDMPDVDIFAIETYEKTGPFGAKGIGEGVLSCVAAAVGNAVFDAVGVRVRDLPISPEKILKGLLK